MEVSQLDFDPRRPLNQTLGVLDYQNNSISAGMFGVAVCSLSVLSHPGPPPQTHTQDVTFLSIEEVTLHHKDAARQPSYSGHFPFSMYDGMSVSDCSHQQRWRGNLVENLLTFRFYFLQTLRPH